MNDPVRIALWLGGASLTIALICATVITLYNGNSRNLGLALGAVGGAVILFVVGVYFELQGSKTTDDFGIEFTIDLSKKEIRRTAYSTPMQQLNALMFDHDVSKIFASSDVPSEPNDEVIKAAKEVAVASVVAYIVQQQFDWQLDSITLRSKTGAIVMTGAPLSGESKCTVIKISEIEQKLKNSGNRFSELSIFKFRPTICLPPQSTMTITDHSVVLDSPVCTLLFDISFMAGSFDRGASTTLFRTRASATYSALRAQAADKSSYQAWARRTIDGAKQWYE
jgi:hypothetical protein